MNQNQSTGHTVQYRMWDASANRMLTNLYVHQFKKYVMSTPDAQCLHDVKTSDLEEKDATLFGAFNKEEELIAAIYVYDKNGDDYYGGLICLPEYRKQNISLNLLHYARYQQNLKFPNRLSVCVIRVFEDGSLNVGAYRLFSKAGYELVGQPQRFYINSDCELHLIETSGPGLSYQNQRMVALPSSIPQAA